MFRCDPEAHVLTKHQSRLRVEPGDRAENGDGDRNERPLQHEPDEFKWAVGRRTFRQEAH